MNIYIYIYIYIYSINIYITYAHPKVEFLTTVWNPGLKSRRYNGLAGKINRVQQVFTRRLFGRCGLTYIRYSERLNYLCLQSLELRRLHKDIIMIYKLIHKICNIDFLIYSIHYRQTIVLVVME